MSHLKFRIFALGLWLAAFNGAFVLSNNNQLSDLTSLFAKQDSISSCHVSLGIKYAYHQYYDIPAWNCNGSVLLFRGEGRVYLVRKLGQAPIELKLTSKPAEYLQWDRNDPDILFYVVYSQKRYTQLYRVNLHTTDKEMIYQTEGFLGLAPPHPDGRHLLLHPRINRTDPAQIFDLETGAVKTIPVPGPVHRVRFTKNPDLSIFCNLETEKDNSSDPRTSWFIDTSTGKTKLLVTGEAGHPDWRPGGNWLSFFQDNGLTIINRNGEPVQRFSGLGGHQSWSDDGSMVVADITYRKSRYVGWIIVYQVNSGEIVPLIEHCSTLTDRQATHPHPVFSPDGTKVVYNSNNFGRNTPQVYVAKVRSPDPVAKFQADLKENTVVLSWEKPRGREIEKYLIYYLTGNKRFLIGENTADKVVYKTKTSEDMRGFQVVAQEHSGLTGKPVTLLLNEAKRID